MDLTFPEFFLWVALGALLATWVFSHASKHGSRRATAWGSRHSSLPGSSCRLLRPLPADAAADLVARRRRHEARRASPSPSPSRCRPSGGRSGSSSPRRSRSTGAILPGAAARGLRRGADAADAPFGRHQTSRRPPAAEGVPRAEVDARRRARDDDRARLAVAHGLRTSPRSSSSTARTRPRPAASPSRTSSASGVPARRRCSRPSSACWRCRPSPTSPSSGGRCRPTLVEGAGFRDSLRRSVRLAPVGLRPRGSAASRRS